MAKAEIGSLADLRPGDIMFTNQAPGGAKLLVAAGQALLHESFVIGELNVGHVGIVVEAAVDRPGWPEGERFIAPPMLVQAMPQGAETIALTAAKHWTPRHAYVRLPEDYAGQAADAAAIARLFVSEGVRYSSASYAALAAWRYGLKVERLEKWIDRRRDPIRFPFPLADEYIRLPCEAICSVLVDQAWSLAGKRVMHGVAHQAVTPGALAGQLWRRVGAVWGGPGILP